MKSHNWEPRFYNDGRFHTLVCYQCGTSWVYQYIPKPGTPVREAVYFEDGNRVWVSCRPEHKNRAIVNFDDCDLMNTYNIQKS